MLTKDCLVVFSGGQDSTTCLYWAMKHYDKVHALTFDYNQRHRTEVTASSIIAGIADIYSHEVLTLPSNILVGTSPLTDLDQDLEQYKDWQNLPGGLEKTYVPGRNALFLTLAANRAFVLGCTTLVTGICQEDSGGYPDCTERFRNRMALMLMEALPKDKDVVIRAPLMYLSKKEIVEWAVDLPGCYRALAYSHTAYDGHYPPLGKDHASLLRAKGFELAGVPDPLVLRAVKERAMISYPDTPNYQGDLSKWLKLLEVL